MRLVAAAIIIAMTSALCGCVIGDRIYSATIEIKMPTQDLDTAKSLLLSAAAPAGYRKGGQWIADGKTYYDYNKPCNWSPECIAQFDKISNWVEAPDIFSENATHFRLSKTNEYKSIEMDLKVNMTKNLEYTNVTITFQELGGMGDWQIRDFNDLRNSLTERFGDQVKFSTDFEHWVSNVPTQIGTKK